MPCTVGQPPVIVGQPDCYTWLPGGQPPSNQIWQAPVNMFFIDKISTIKMEFPLLEVCLPMYSFVDIDIIMPACTAVFDTFHPLSCDVLSSLISKLNKTTCVLDPFPTKLLMSHLSSILDIILCIVNLCFSSGVFPTPCKNVSPPSFFL